MAIVPYGAWAWQVLKGTEAMFTVPMETFDFLFRYQRTPGAQYHARPLSLLQQDVMYRCDGKVTVADLADATLATHPEVRAALVFLSEHGLVKILPPDPTLLPSAPHKPAAPASVPVGSRSRLLSALKRAVGLD
jgi:hypothetical protein